MCHPKVLQVQNRLGVDASSFRAKFAGNVTAGQCMCCRQEFTHWFSNFHSYYMNFARANTDVQCTTEFRTRSGDRGITAKNMEKSQLTDFNKDATSESASVACNNVRL